MIDVLNFDFALVLSSIYSFSTQKKLQWQTISCEQERLLLELCQAMNSARSNNHSFPILAMGLASFNHRSIYFHSVITQRSYPDKQFQCGSIRNSTTKYKKLCLPSHNVADLSSVCGYGHRRNLTC